MGSHSPSQVILLQFQDTLKPTTRQHSTFSLQPTQTITMFSQLNLLGLMAAIPLSLAAAVPSNLTYRAAEFLPKNATADFSVQAAPRWYSGPWQNFPAMNTWVGTFDALFEKNKASMRSTGSTADDVGRINVAIREAAKIGVDERVILSIIMQGGYISSSVSAPHLPFSRNFREPSVRYTDQ